MRTRETGWLSSRRRKQCLHLSRLSDRVLTRETRFRLNMRTAFNTYRVLGKYLEEVDAAAQAAGKGPEDKSVDIDFRSGVYLGVGLSNLVLSMMPSRLLSLIELFGYKGDRHVGLKLLYKAGGWTKDSKDPSVASGE